MFENCDEDAKKEGKIEALVGGESLLEFISKNKVLLNALGNQNHDQKFDIKTLLEL